MHRKAFLAVLSLAMFSVAAQVDAQTFPSRAVTLTTVVTSDEDSANDVSAALLPILATATRP